MTERREVIVIGGGQAGLAIGYFLAQQGRQFAILEAADIPAAAWRARWKSLQLFTPVRYDSLPGRAFPGDPDSYPRRDQVVTYLTDYARHFELPVVLNSRVRSLRRADGDARYVVELDDRTYAADQIVVATGPFEKPLVPPLAADLDPHIVQFHSSAYQTPESIPPGPVLVVGGGNTGFQIADELAATHEVHLSIGSKQTPLPQRILGRDLFWYLERTGLMQKPVTSRVGRRMKARDQTLIGNSPRGLRKKTGVMLHPRTTRTGGAKVTFSDGTALTVNSVIWATGFGLDHSWIELPVFDESGGLVHKRGMTTSEGLYFLGLPWQHTRGSALLGWVKDDAEYIADSIGAFANTKMTQATRPMTSGLAPSTAAASDH